jgi:maltooligosyltrehalose synthase
LLRDWKTRRIKLFLIQRLLTFRAEHRALFLKGSYNPLVVTGKERIT